MGLALSLKNSALYLHSCQRTASIVHQKFIAGKKLVNGLPVRTVFCLNSLLNLDRIKSAESIAYRPLQQPFFAWNDAALDLYIGTYCACGNEVGIS